ncbi:MAG: hypothetical protein AB1641_27360 [Thermodesulfobacteriota bacterium]
MGRNLILAATLCLALTWGSLEPAWAAPEWLEGVITQGPRIEHDRRLGVNNILFTLTADAAIYERIPMSDGTTNEEPIPFNRLGTGQKVLVLREGIRAFQVILLR